MKIEPDNIYISSYNYELPPEKIAAHPLSKRDESRLLEYREGRIHDDHFSNIVQRLPPDGLLVLNNSRVIEARILFQKTTGASIEIFCLEPHGQSVESGLASHKKVQWNCMIGGASKWKPGQILEKDITVGHQQAQLFARYITKQEDSFIIEFSWQPQQLSFSEILHGAGAIPLPPYIKRNVIEEDKERYQTVFASHEGSVAAPTAALHFTPAILEQLREKNIQIAEVTLHVGAGTFKPVKTETVATHQMHHEPFTVSKKTLEDLIHFDKVVAVGTTSLRTIESIYWLGVKLIQKGEDKWNLDQWEAYELEKYAGEINKRKSLQSLIDWMNDQKQELIHCQTSLIIVPGYQFKIPSALITNFHQPQSTLLLLVSAFIGEDWKKVYQHALDSGYRFLSYGDSSLLWRNT
ncbi:MAG: S-adenosylmethionine:tRNA ribosyltransferase-isomerase [Flavisolibacter sp.]